MQIVHTCTHFCLHLCLAKIAKYLLLGVGCVFGFGLSLLRVVLVVHLVLVVLVLLTLVKDLLLGCGFCLWVVLRCLCCALSWLHTSKIAKDLLLGVGCSTLSCLCTLSCLQCLKISYWGLGSLAWALCLKVVLLGPCVALSWFSGKSWLGLGRRERTKTRQHKAQARQP